MHKPTNKQIFIALGGALTGVVAAAAVVLQRPHVVSRPSLVYSSAGYGGMVPASSALPGHSNHAKASDDKHLIPTSSDLIAFARRDYVAGRYEDAKQDAETVIHLASAHPSLPYQRQAAFARQVVAYAVAREAVGPRRKAELGQAREEFAALETQARLLPDRGIEAPGPGQQSVTLLEEAAFQHAVCTGALGQTKSAEQEYVTFMQRYPDSPLVTAAIKRIGRLYGGDAPFADVAVWHKAMQISNEQIHQADIADSLCGPACLSHFLSLHGIEKSIDTLSKQMGTGIQGTSLAALAEVANHYGFNAVGMSLAPGDLQTQNFPLIALIQPGHYVIVESVTSRQVNIWDPDGSGLNRPQDKLISLADWTKRWGGIVLQLKPKNGSSLSQQSLS